jgi:serine/threonine protein kinase
LPIAETQAIVLPLCGALQLAHDTGIVHRDLKPANVVAHDFGGGTRLHKIVDFGLVRQLRSDETRLTAAHEFLGTFTYAAPEQLLGGSVDARSDQYSLAVIVYEMLTGRTPLEERDPGQFVTALIRNPLRLRVAAPAGSAGVDERRPRPRAGEVAGRSLSVDCGVRDGTVGRCRAFDCRARQDRARTAPAACSGPMRWGAARRRTARRSDFRGTHRARPSRRDPATAAEPRSQHGTLFARASSAESSVRYSRASVDHAGPRLRRRRRPPSIWSPI